MVYSLRVIRYHSPRLHTFRIWLQSWIYSLKNNVPRLLFPVSNSDPYGHLRTGKCFDIGFRHICVYYEAGVKTLGFSRSTYSVICIFDTTSPLLQTGTDEPGPTTIRHPQVVANTPSLPRARVAVACPSKAQARSARQCRRRFLSRRRQAAHARPSLTCGVGARSLTPWHGRTPTTVEDGTPMPATIVTKMCRNGPQ